MNMKDALLDSDDKKEFLLTAFSLVEDLLKTITDNDSPTFEDLDNISKEDIEKLSEEQLKDFNDRFDSLKGK